MRDTQLWEGFILSLMNEDNRDNKETTEKMSKAFEDFEDYMASNEENVYND